MDRFINSIIETAFKKPATPFLKEVFKGIIILVSGFILSYAIAVSNNSYFDSTAFMIAVYPLGLYYGYASTFKTLKGFLRRKPKNMPSSGNIGADTAVSFMMYVVFFLLALIIGWFAGIFNYIKLLMKYSKEPISNKSEDKFTLN